VAQVAIFGPGSGNLVAGNDIGTDATGTIPLGNGPWAGVLLQDAVATQVGGIGDMGNNIAFSGGAGAEIVGGNGNSIRGNSIFANAALGIDRDGDGVTLNTPEGPANFPVLSTAYAGSSSTVVGTLNSTPNATVILDFYADAAPDPSGYGQGQFYLGSTTVTTDSNGNASFTATGLGVTSAGQWISATSTGPAGDTSEFCQDVKALYFDTTTLTSSANPSVHGQAVTFTATVAAINSAYGTPTGSVQFVVDGTNVGASVTLVNGSASSAAIASLGTANHSVTAVYSGDTNFVAGISAAITQVVNQDRTTTAVIASPAFANVGQIVTFTSTVAANAPGSGTPTGTVDFFDTTTNTDLTPGGVSLSSGTASFSTTSLTVGSHTIKATYSGDTNFLTSNASTGTITIGQSIVVLDPSAGGALSVSGNASINLSGGVYVDSSSSTALSASGNATVTASTIQVVGHVQRSGNASLSPAPTTGAATVADPLAGLTEPSTSGLTNYGSESLSGNSSATIQPGIYSKITVSGNARLTMNGGIYLIEGGGFSVSGNASVTGSGVMIFNAGSRYPTTGGTYGSITLSGNGSYSLSPPTTGTYAGIVIFQSRDDANALTLSGDASGTTGLVYAPAAQLAESGNGQLNAAIIADAMTISGNGIANTVTLSSPPGTVAYSPAQILAAYGINGLGDGTGQTIAIVDAYDDPSIFQGLDVFDSQFGLTASGQTLYAQYGSASSFLTVLNQCGQATSLPSTDPNGPGTDNWEVEEALDVEWTHAIAPGAQIILVEANSQALSDLMASVSTAASQPGVSVLSMSWGFPEGQAVFASDEATYDSYFNVPGVTFIASTGDYGAADPEYPAFSPNVVAVGGTSLTLNADNSYNSEMGWGYYSDSVGAFIGSGGGISQYETEPAYQQCVQSIGYRTTPDVSLVADPATGAWIADPYNLDPSNPFEIVGGTSLSAPAWAGLFALVNQGRVAAGESTLNSASPTDTQQALYMLPQSGYNAIASGNNGYSAGAGYNLVTGLGTPVASSLVPDLVAYQGSGTTYSGPTVGALQNSTLTSTGTNSSGPLDVFSVFDSLTVTHSGFGYAQNVGRRGDFSTLLYGTLSAGGADATTLASRYLVTPFAINPVAAGSDFVTIGGAVRMMPLDTETAITALDSALTHWSSSQAAVATSETSAGGADPGQTITGRSVLILGGSRTPVLQAAVVDAVLEEFGSLPSLQSREGTNPLSNAPKARKS
jgi:hypothetical protein